MAERANAWYYEWSGQVFGPFSRHEIYQQLVTQDIPAEAKLYFFDGERRVYVDPRTILAKLPRAGVKATPPLRPSLGPRETPGARQPVPPNVGRGTPDLGGANPPPYIAAQVVMPGIPLASKRSQRRQLVLWGSLAAVALLTLIALGVGTAVLVTHTAPTGGEIADSQKPPRVEHQPPMAVEPNPQEDDVAQADPDAKPARPDEAGTQYGGGPPQVPPPGPPLPAPVAPVPDGLAVENQGPQPWIETVQNACVVVISITEDGTGGQGSGFFVNGATQSPVVVTNYHVVKGAKQVAIKLRSGAVYVIRRGALFPRCDLAFLVVDNLKQAPAVLELRADLPKLTEVVYASGAPGGLEATITKGIVSSIRKTSDLPEVISEYDEIFWIQTDTPINPGNSGGPLIDSAGRVVGISTWGFKNREGLNFAVAAVEAAKRLRNAQFVALQTNRSPSSTIGDSNAEDNAWFPTVAYWIGLKLFVEIVQDQEQQIEAVLDNPLLDTEVKLRALAKWANTLETVANTVSELPTGNVDREAALAGQALAAFYREMAGAVRGLLRELLNGAITNTPPAVIAARIQHISVVFDRRASKLISVIEASRKSLRQRSGLNFPPLFE